MLFKATLPTIALFIVLFLADAYLFSSCSSSTTSYSTQLVEDAPPPSLRISATALLSGCYVGSTQLMRDDLRTLGYLPMVSPYDDAVYAAPGIFSFSGLNAIVDWVQLRLQSTDTTITYSALLQRNGQLVDANANPIISIEAPANYYQVQLQHRNHLAIQLAEPIYLYDSLKIIDFTNPSTPLFQNQSYYPTRIIGGKRALYAGNALADNKLTYQGTTTDRMAMYIANQSQGYFTQDADMNGKVDFLVDKNVLLLNLGNQPAATIYSQTNF